MSDLDDKIRNVLMQQENHIKAYLHGVKNPGIPKTEDAIAQIKQAFAEEGYISVKEDYELKVDIDNSLSMAGREWYERFSAALTSYGCLRINVGSVDWDSGDVMRAAKKAAGLE